VAGEQISGRQLDVVLVVSGRNVNDILLHVRHQMMGVEQRLRKWMKPEVFWSHGHTDKDVPVEAVEEERGFHLKEVRVVVNEQFASGFVGSPLQLVCIGTTTQKSPQNQPGEMRIRQQGSLVPGFHSYSRRDQTGKKKTQGYQGRQTTHRYQDDLIICGPVQFLQDAHQGLCSHHGTIIQAYKKGFRVQIRAAARKSLERFLHPTKTTHF